MSESQPSVTDTAPTDPSGGETELKRAITPKLLLLFIVGDILGTGVYSLTGKVAGQVGGAGWVPIIIAFAIALLSALSYLEMVTKYPQTAGAALYVHKAFGIHFLTFMVTFAVLSSGITSAATSSVFLAENFLKAFHLDESMGADASKLTATVIAVVFICLVACINMYGVSESVKANVVLTLIELTGLALVILVGFFAIFQGNADFSRVILFETPGDKSLFMAVIGATALAFFSMVGFEDSVKNFPKMLIGGLSITGVVYILVSVTAVAVVPIGELESASTPLLSVVHHGAPNLPIDDIFPFISIFAVANTVLINMMMASRLLYGMSKQGVLPGFMKYVLKKRQSPWSAIVFSTALGVALILAVRFVLGEETIGALGGTTALLLRSGQHLGAGAAQGHRGRRPLRDADGVARHRSHHLVRVGGAVGAGDEELRDRERTTGHRPRALHRHLGVQRVLQGASDPFPPSGGPGEVTHRTSPGPGLGPCPASSHDPALPCPQE
jgi:amino acid transporter